MKKLIIALLPLVINGYSQANPDNNDSFKVIQVPQSLKKCVDNGYCTPAAKFQFIKPKNSVFIVADTYRLDAEIESIKNNNNSCKFITSEWNIQKIECLDMPDRIGWYRFLNFGEASSEYAAIALISAGYATCSHANAELLRATFSEKYGSRGQLIDYRPNPFRIIFQNKESGEKLTANLVFGQRNVQPLSCEGNVALSIELEHLSRPNEYVVHSLKEFHKNFVFESEKIRSSKNSPKF